VPYRVVQWATGVVGRYALRSLLERPDLELAAVVVSDPAKVGTDAGRLAGVAPVGIAATSDADAALSVPADCVLHAAAPSVATSGSLEPDLALLERMLAAGRNVVTTAGFLYPQALGADVAQRLAAACQAGNSTLLGTGLNPGFMSDLVPVVLSSLTARVDGVYARESSDMTGYGSVAVVREQLGLGLRGEDYQRALRRTRPFLSTCFTEPLHLVAAALGRRLDAVVATDEALPATRPLETATGVVAAGAVRANRWQFTGLVGGAPFVRLEAVYAVGARQEPAWYPPGFSATIDGRPRVALHLGETWLSNGLLATAMRAVNAVPAVCRADPGLLTVLDLPPRLLTPPGGAGNPQSLRWQGGASLPAGNDDVGKA